MQLTFSSKWTFRLIGRFEPILDGQLSRQLYLFTRSGKLEEYDSLLLYYVGMGGNSNKTTRFRRYDGKSNRELIVEHVDTAHLFKPNYTYAIKFINHNSKVSYWVDEYFYFSYIPRGLFNS